MDEFDHGAVSDDNEQIENTNVVAAPDQSEAPVAIEFSPSTNGPKVGGSFSGFGSPPQKIVIRRKGKKWSRDLPVIPKFILAKAGTVVLSSALDTLEEE